MAFTINQFNNYKSNINDAYTIYLLDSINEEIQEIIGAPFFLTADYKQKYYGNNTNLVSIGAWQKTGLVIKKGSEGVTNPTLTTLVERRDYILKPYKRNLIPNKPAPITKVQLLGQNQSTYGNYGSDYNSNQSLQDFFSSTNNNLSSEEFLEVTGTFGWANGLPSTLNNLLYQIVNDLIVHNEVFNNSEGRGVVASEKSRSLSVSYEGTDSAKLKIRNLALGIVNDPAVMKVLLRYKQNIDSNVRIS